MNSIDPVFSDEKPPGKEKGGKPYLIIFSTMSLDGKIADKSGYSLLSCEEDFQLLHRFRSWADAVMVGSNTALKDNPRLTVRLARGYSGYRIVVDGKLRVPVENRLFSVPGKGILITTEGWEREKLAPYLEKGIRVIEAGKGKVDLAKALKSLYEMVIVRLLVEGGGGLNCALLAEKLVDEVHITLAPRVFGGGASVFEGDCSSRLVLSGFFRLCGGWIHLVYKPVYYY
jgi:2,5-diamino-6-(ribosylamino)-4(3H)-pyrimidinone 5'-phosphate reductase